MEISHMRRAAGNLLSRIRPRDWAVTGPVLLVVAVLSLVPEPVRQALELRGNMVDAGEYWRLFSGQLVHLSFNHALLNLGGYLVVAIAYRRELTPLREMFSLVACAAAVGLGIWQLQPGLYSYVGLSGAIYGLLSCAIVIGCRQSPTISLLFATYLIARFLYEKISPAATAGTAEFIGGPVVVDSHIYGAVAGLATGILWVLAEMKTGGQRRKISPSPQPSR